jgi:hypothetical protein
MITTHVFTQAAGTLARYLLARDPGYRLDPRPYGATLHGRRGASGWRPRDAGRFSTPVGYTRWGRLVGALAPDDRHAYAGAAALRAIRAGIPTAPNGDPAEVPAHPWDRLTAPEWGDWTTKIELEPTAAVGTAARLRALARLAVGGRFPYVRVRVDSDTGSALVEATDGHALVRLPAWGAAGSLFGCGYMPAGALAAALALVKGRGAALPRLELYSGSAYAGFGLELPGVTLGAAHGTAEGPYDWWPDTDAVLRRAADNPRVALVLTPAALGGRGALAAAARLYRRDPRNGPRVYLDADRRAATIAAPGAAPGVALAPPLVAAALEAIGVPVEVGVEPGKPVRLTSYSRGEAVIMPLTGGTR